MLRCTLLLLLSGVVSPVVAGPREDAAAAVAKLRARAAEALDGGEYERGRLLLREIIKRGDRAADSRARLDLALTYPVTREHIAQRITLLKQVVEFGADSWAARQAAALLEALRREKRWMPKIVCGVVPRVVPGRLVPVSRKGRGSSSFSIYRVDSDAWRAALLAAPFAKMPLEPEPFAKEFVGSAVVRFPYATNSRVKGDFTRPGIYVLHENSFGHETTHVVRAEQTSISCRVVGSDGLCFAFDPRTGEPVAGVNLVVRTPAGDRKRTTDAHGVARFSLKGDGAIVAWRGDEVHALRIDGDDRPAERALVHISTDRPVYRPGHMVHYKAVRRLTKDGVLALGPAGKVRVEVRDPQGRIVQERTHSWSDHGSVAGEFRLAGRCTTGEYSVMVHVRRDERDMLVPWWYEEEEAPPVWTQSFLVASYKKPEMRLRVELVDGDDGGGGTGKRKAKVRVRAEYYHGGPVAGALVSWSVDGSWWGWGSRGRGGLRPPFREPLGWFARLYDYVDDEEWTDDLENEGLVGDGEGETNAEGVLEFEFDVDPDGGNASYDVFAALTDESDQVVSTKKTLSIRRSALAVEAGFDKMFFEKGAIARLFAHVTDHAGKPLANRKVELSAFLNTPDHDEDQFEFESVFRQTLMTGADGVAHADVTLRRSGRLRLRVRAQDDAGHTASDRSEVWVAGPRAAHAWDPDESAGGPIEVIPERRIYRPGETMRFMVLNSDAPQACLLTVEGDKIHDARVIRLTKRAQVIEVPATAAHAPNVIVKLNAWGGLESLSGGFEVFVCPESRLIPVTIETDKAEYAPRERATVVVRAVPGAEIELAIVDESIFDIAKDTVPDMLPTFLRRAKGLHSLAGFSDDAWGTLRRDDREDEDSEVPLFGGQTEAMVAFEVPPGAAAVTTRRFFPDTLHWTGRMIAGADGRAIVNVTTPDSLTRWRLVARAIHGTDRFGQGRSEVRTRKSVVVRPVAPRFLTVGDEATVGAIVHNNLDKPQEFTIRCEAKGLSIEGSKRTAMIPAGGKVRMNWKVRAPRTGSAQLGFAAFARAESDAAQVTLPVRSPKIERRVRAAGAVEGTWSATLQSPVDGGELEIVVSSAGDAVRQALPYLARYPYGCVEQTMSRFLPAVVAYRALGKDDAFARRIPDMVQAGLQRLYDFQHEDFGWGWWKNDETDPLMTAYVVMGLCRARDAGFAIDPKTLALGVERLEEMEPDPFRTYALHLAGKKTAAPRAHTPVDHAYLVLAGHRAAARGLKLELADDHGPEDIANVALVLRALHKANPDDPRIRKAVDWLLRQRRGTKWYSTLDTAHVVTALVELGLKTKRPDVSVTVNGKPVKLQAGRAVVPAQQRNEIAVRTLTPKGVYASAVLRYRDSEKKRTDGDAFWTVARRLERDGKRLPDGAVLARGDRLMLVVEIAAERDARYVMMRVPLPAGLEPNGRPIVYDEWIFGRAALFDDAAELAATVLEKGHYSVEIPLTATTAGTFRATPVQVFDMYNPDREAFSSPLRVQVR